MERKKETSINLEYSCQKIIKAPQILLLGKVTKRTFNLVI